MLAPVAYPWPGGVGWYNKVVTIPVVGPLLAYTITLPLGFFLTEPGARGVFLPQIMPDDFVGNTATPLLLRPREFLANARDLVALKAAVAEQAPRYPHIRVPTVVITGEIDKTVSTNRHSRPFAKAVPNAKLIVLPGCRSYGAERRARTRDKRDRCHDQYDRAPHGGRCCQLVDGVVLMPSTSSTPCRKIKAFPELRSVVTKAIFAGRSTSASSGDRSPHRLSVRERRIRWRRPQRRGRARTRLETGSRRMEGKSAVTICPPRREHGRSIGSTRPALRQHLRSARRLFRKIA
jgi:hypothetical protein